MLLEVFHNIHYSYYSASSSAITKEMNGISRKAVCDIINFSEIILVNFENCSALRYISSAASKVLSTLSFDKSETLNDILDNYLYEERARTFRKSFGNMVLPERTMS